MTNIITEAVSIINEFNPECAQAFRDQPSRRVDRAMAFAAGFAKKPTDDVHPMAAIVIEIAMMDQRRRQLDAKVVMLNETIAAQS